MDQDEAQEVEEVEEEEREEGEGDQRTSELVEDSAQQVVHPDDHCMHTCTTIKLHGSKFRE